VDLIAGLPYETYEIFQNSFNDIYKMNADKIHLGFLKVLKGSYMQKTADDYGIVYDGFAPYKILKSNFISFPKLRYLEKIESIVETYYNSGNFANTIAYGVSLFESPYVFYDRFCKHLLGKDYFNRPHKFVYYFDVLYDFLALIKNADMQYSESVLLHDFCTNSKPRVYPERIKATHSQKRKQIARDFYNNPANIQKYLPHFEGISPSTISRQCNIELHEYDVTSKSIQKKETCILYDYSSNTKIIKIN